MSRFGMAMVVCVVFCLVFVGLACVDLVGTGGGEMDGPSGEVLYSTAYATTGGGSLACADCHGVDGSGEIGPDVRGANGSHLQEHAQEEGRHAEGVKFPDLSLDDFNAIALFLGGSASPAEGDGEDEEALVGDSVRGIGILVTPQMTVGGAMLACASCHGADGSGDVGPDIRGEPVGHLEEHAQGGGSHPDGIKFPDLTDQDFADIAAALAAADEGGDKAEE